MPESSSDDNTLLRTEPGWGAAPPMFGPPKHAGEVGTFGRYRVLKKLGQGGMGAVYLGYDEALDRKVALKVMLQRASADSAARERFLREARSAAQVKSDHVVTIFDVGEQNGTPFIAMDYLLGAPLDAYLKQKGELPVGQAVRVARETALGLAAAHDLGYVHRDIKPGNLWLEAPKGRVKLLDFGLARAATDDTNLTGSGAVMGTPAYMSPEQARAKPVDGRSDLFSVGVLLYRLLTGKLPFNGDTTIALLTALAVDTPESPRALNPEVSPELDALVMKVLCKDPAGRYQTAGELAAALLAVEQGRAAGPQPHVVALSMPTMAVGAQTQNVWEGIDDSASYAVPLATPAEGTGTVVAGAARAPAQRPSQRPLLLAVGGLSLAVLVLVGTVLALNGKKPPVEPEAKPPPTPPPVSPERRAAEWALSAGGVVTVSVNGDARALRKGDPLPRGPFVIEHLNVSGLKAVTDADLAVLRDLKSLRGLDLSDTNLTDAGAAHLAGCTGLRHFSAARTAIGNAGVVNLRNCTELVTADLSRSPVTDAGLGHLANCTKLELVNLPQTGVTAGGVTAFAKAHPTARVVWDGGEILPTEADRAAATYARSVGALISVVEEGGGRRDLAVGDELPKDAFTLVGVHFGATARVTDDGLAAFAGTTRLLELSMHNASAVTDAGLARFAGNKTLTKLVISGNTPVTAVGLKHFAGNSELLELWLHDRPLADDHLKPFHGCTKLRQLVLANAQVGDAAVRPFGACPDLQHFDLSGTRATAAVLPHFHACTKLTTFFLTGTGITRAQLEETAKKLPNCRIECDGGTIEPRPAADRDRALAEFVFSKGGSVCANGDFKNVTAVGDLPKGPFRLTGVLFGERSTVSDADLARFADFTGLAYLSVVASKDVTDAGLAHFKGNTGLTHLYFVGIPIGDAGLAHFKDCPKLNTVDLTATKVTTLAPLAGRRELLVVRATNTAVTDDGLKALTGTDELRLIELEKTKVSATAVAEFAKRCPKCKVVWDGGTIEPTQK